jgi:hypothetical protein
MNATSSILKEHNVRAVISLMLIANADFFAGSIDQLNLIAQCCKVQTNRW